MYPLRTKPNIDVLLSLQDCSNGPNVVAIESKLREWSQHKMHLSEEYRKKDLFNKAELPICSPLRTSWWTERRRSIIGCQPTPEARIGPRHPV